MVTPGMPAFPTPSGWDTSGMNLRTWIATQLVAANIARGNTSTEDAVIDGVVWADALIKELNK